MPYRGRVAVQRAGETQFSYYECVDDHNDCPVCGKHAGWDVNRNVRLTRCYPEKRIAIRGMLWWKTRCPLEGVHDHYRCRECNTIWVCFHITRQPSKKIRV